MADDEAKTPEDPWLTLNEIAEELRLSPATIRSWISDGTLRAMRGGRRKWLVRRSELERMLAGADMAGPGDPPDVPDWRAFDTIAPPHRSPHWTNPEALEHVSPKGWLGYAESEWRDALRESAMAPPDPWFVSRLRRIAEAAARKAAALANLEGQEPGPWWLRQSGLANRALSYELRPGGTRPGPPELWLRFDTAVDELATAMQEHSVPAEQLALERLSLVLHEIADALDEAAQYPWSRGGDPEPRTSESAGDADEGDDDHRA